MRTARHAVATRFRDGLDMFIREAKSFLKNVIKYRGGSPREDFVRRRAALVYYDVHAPGRNYFSG